MKLWIMLVSDSGKEFTDIMLNYNKFSKEYLKARNFLDNIDGSSKKENYVPLKVKKMNKNGHLLNTVWLTSSVIVLDDKAVEILKDFINLYGELLPLDLKENDKNLYIFNVTNIIDCLYKEKSEIEFFQSTKRYGNVRRPFFKKEIICDNDIFRIPEHGKGFVFISDNVKNLIETTGLKGFSFKLIWDSESDKLYKIC